MTKVLKNLSFSLFIFSFFVIIILGDNMIRKVRINNCLYDIAGNIDFKYTTYTIVFNAKNDLKFLRYKNGEYTLPNHDYNLKADSDIKLLNEKYFIKNITKDLEEKLAKKIIKITEVPLLIENINKKINEDKLYENFLYLNLEIDEAMFLKNINDLMEYFNKRNVSTEEVEILDFELPTNKITVDDYNEEPRVNIDEFLQAKKEEKLEATIRIQKANLNKEILFSAIADSKTAVLDKNMIDSLYQMDDLTERQAEILNQQMDLLDDENYVSYFDTPKKINKPSLSMAGFTNALILGLITGCFSIVCIIYMIINLG